tara:strand:- start:3285 stop:3584 length:300 start_codon:yes stop_codon:yes gene_type:complete
MKLVRDYIPDIIHASNRDCNYYRVTSPDQLTAFLKDKMVEELNEFIEDPCPEEAGDMLEVFLSLLKLKGVSFEDVEQSARKKKMQKGGFDEGFILTDIY